MPQPDQNVGAMFPIMGLDVTSEFGRQPEMTTPAAVNVVTHEVVSDRARGGSRPGLTPFVDEQHSGNNRIQHLNILVDPQNQALNAEHDEPGGVLDPSSNENGRNFGRIIRPGGSGRRPAWNDPTGGPVERVRKYRQQLGNIAGVTEVTLPVQPDNQSLLVVLIRTEKVGIVAELVSGVTNADLNAFTQVGGAGYRADAFSVASTKSLTAWYRLANAGSPDQTIRVTPGGTGIYEVIVVEYRNILEAGPLSNNAKNEDPSNASLYFVPNLELNGTTGQLVLAFFTGTTISVTPLDGYSGLYGTLGGDTANMVVIEKAGLSGSGEENPSANVGLASPYAGIAMALTR